MTFWEAAGNWEIALDGWIGAVLGAGVSTGVAVYVLRKTLASEREQFLEQLHSERKLAMDQLRLESFGDVSGQLRRLQTLPDHAEARQMFADISTAVSRWRLYLGESARLGLMLEALALTLVRLALVRAASGVPADERSRMGSILSKSVQSTVENGRRWHLGELDEEMLHKRWMKLHSDLEAGLPSELPGRERE